MEGDKEPRPFPTTKKVINGVAWMPGERQAVCATGTPPSVQLWDIEKGELLRTFEGHNSGVAGVDVSPDGRSILSCSYDGTVRWWDVATGRQRQLLRQGDFVRAVMFTPDGRRAISAGGGRGTPGKYTASGNDFPIRVWTLSDEPPARKP